MKVWSVPAPEFYDDEELDVPSTVVEDFLRQVEIIYGPPGTSGRQQHS